MVQHSITTTVIILAAGRGSRMQGLTDDKPKCLLKLAGRPLLHWQLEALKAAGLKRIVVVRGYKKEMLTGDFETVDNPHWAASNMVTSLMCALPVLTEEKILVAYADIVYKAEHVKKLLTATGDICLTYDRDWESLWRLRNENPLEDAETFATQKGQLVEIGGKPDNINQVQGQYMGLVQFSKTGLEQVVQYVNSLPEHEIDKMDMTSLLRGLLERNTHIQTIGIHGGWCECDTERDIEIYEKALRLKNWAHDWR